jgi:preflagellin peptidase FlaK
MDELTWARIGLATLVMVVASISDWRSRTAPNANWYILGLGGSLILGWELWDEGASWVVLACLALITLVFLDLLWDRPGIFEDGINPLPLVLYALTLVAYAYLTLEHFNGDHYWTVMTIPLLFILFFLLYQFDVIKGGADAKALIALSLCFPTYPILEGLPLLVLNDPASLGVLPFPLVVLFNGAVLTLLVPLALFTINLLRRDLRFPLMFFGLRMDIDEAPSQHVWAMEKVVEGRIKTTLFPRSDEDDDWNDLRTIGVERPWVTPKIPFLIPLTLALPFSLLVGNLLLLIVGA